MNKSVVSIKKITRTHTFLNRFGFTVLVFFLIITDTGCGGSNGKSERKNTSENDLDTAILEQMDAAGLPGAIVYAIKDSQVVFSKGYGYANIDEGRPVTNETIFQVASVSKLVTATALMLLHEQGEFGLDDDVNAYLPFNVRNPNYPDEIITFRMLLTHTSSIFDADAYEDTYVFGDPDEALGDFLTEYFASNGALYNAETNFTEQRPGEGFQYSNIAFGLIGFLVERIADLPFDQFCQQQIFNPLGMDSTHWYHQDVDQSRWASPYSFNGQSYTSIGSYSFSTFPDGALKTTAADFARFLAPFINGGNTVDGQPFLNSGTVTEMLTVQNPEIEPPVGLAWSVGLENALYEHTGGDPGIFSLVQVLPGKRFARIVFTNGDGDNNVRALSRFFENIELRVLEALGVEI